MEAWRQDLYLAHHGVLGMKWGVRRYQNPDGTLTPAGRARYEGKKSYKSNEKRMSKDYSKNESAIRKLAKTNLGLHKVDEIGVKFQKKMADKKDELGMNSKVHRDFVKKKEISKKEYDEYIKHTSTGKLIAQDFMFGKVGSAFYRSARARGEGRVRSAIESNLGILGISLAIIGNRKRFGITDVLAAGDDTGDIL